MRYVELRRHTDNDGEVLSRDGIVAAERIGAERLHPPYALFVSSGAARATQMLQILSRYADQDDVEIVEETGLRSTVEGRWRAAAKSAAKTAGKAVDLDAVRSVEPDLVDAESRLLGSALRSVIDSLPEGGRALVVGHSPTNEAAVFGLTGHMVAPLGEGEGVLVTESGGRYRVGPLD